MCFVDLTKAFDYINRAAMFYKMSRSGVKGKMLQVLVSLFNNAHSRVRVNNELSEGIDSIFGVLQGGVISPKLFINFLTDISQYLDVGCGAKIGSD